MILFGKGVFADVIILRALNIRYINRSLNIDIILNYLAVTSVSNKCSMKNTEDRHAQWSR